MEAQVVWNEDKDAAKDNVNYSDKVGNKVFIEIDQVLEMKDVQELDDLPSSELSECANVKSSSDKYDKVTGEVTVGSPDIVHDIQRPGNQVTH